VVKLGKGTAESGPGPASKVKRKCLYTLTHINIYSGCYPCCFSDLDVLQADRARNKMPV